MRPKDETKQLSIREKAIELVAKGGLDGFSMQKLAKAAKVSPATLYIYYKDKDDLLRKICTEVSTELLNDSLRNFDPEVDFEEGLRIQWENRAAYFMKHPMEVEFVEQIRYSPLYDRVRANLSNRFGEVMGKFVHNAIRRKQLAKLPFEVYWSVAFAPLYQLIKFHSTGRSYVNVEFTLTNKILMQTLQLTLKALRP